MIVQDQELLNWVIRKVVVVSQINYLSQSLAFCSTLSNCLLFSALLHNESHEFCAKSTIIVLHYSLLQFYYILTVYIYVCTIKVLFSKIRCVAYLNKHLRLEVGVL